jgi:hypothetical protein
VACDRGARKPVYFRPARINPMRWEQVNNQPTRTTLHVGKSIWS